VVIPANIATHRNDQDESSTVGRRVGQANLYTARQMGRFSKQPKNAKCIEYYIEDIKKSISKQLNEEEVVEGTEPPPPQTVIIDTKKLSVFCGFDDGNLAVYDMSPLLEQAGIDVLNKEMAV